MNAATLSLSYGERGDRVAVGEGRQASRLQSFVQAWNPSSVASRHLLPMGEGEYFEVGA